MEKLVNTYLRFFDSDALAEKHFDMSQEPSLWIEPRQVAEIFGVPVTIGACTQIGKWAAGRGFKSKKSGGRRFILLPPQRC